MQLNMEQNKLINSTLMGHSMIKGVAGSGKTTVAVNRISFLLSNYCFESTDKVLMVTYNKSLIRYIEHIYNSIKEDVQLNIFDTAKACEKLTIINIDKLLYSHFSKYNSKNKTKIKIISNEQQLSILRECIIKISERYSDVKLLSLNNLNFIKNEISWIKACNYLVLEEYQNVDRVGRTSKKVAQGPQKLLKNSNSRKAIFNVLLLYQKKLKENNLCDFEDIALSALEYIKNYKTEQYTHIIIDESQDLSRTQLECLNGLHDRTKMYSSILFVSDTAQSIYPTSWLVKGRSFTSIGLDMTGKSNMLTKNYRTTTQIAESAYSLIKNDVDIVEDDNFVKPSLIDRQGSYPVLKGFNTLKDELFYIKNLISNILSKKYNLGDIAIVARNKRILQEVDLVLGSDIGHVLYNSTEGIDFDSDDLKLLTMHSIKGLEFKVVILIGLSEGTIPNSMSISENEDSNLIDSMERKLLYVGMTRATDRLYMSFNRKPSKFLMDIDSCFLKLQDGSLIRNYYKVPLDKYTFMNKITDPYSKEEQVRQWFIKELITMYHYPESLINVEYEVQLFSKKGFVDIVIMINRNNAMIPYIIAELKQLDSNISQALEQVKSYMTVIPTCCYAIACNGNDFIVLNRNYEIVDDIPAFDISMMPSSIEHYEYMDLNKNRTYTFMLDGENSTEIVLEDNGKEETLKGNRLVKIPIFTNIAAGSPILIIDEVTEMRYMPYDWIVNHTDTFMLRVKGDSMINANINNGDYIIIQKQATADNGCIVAVEVDGGTTLKRLRKMGSMVLLIPENQEYEPIAVSSDAVRIIGIAVGVVKKL